MESLLTDKGKVLLSAARTRCDPRVVAEKEGVTMDNAFTVPVAQVDALLGPAGKTVPFRVNFPLMLGIGMADELIAPARQEATVRALCRAGNAIVRKRYAGSRHGETLTRSADDAVSFARSVLSGEVPASDCQAAL